MTGTSVLFDAPGPKARRTQRVASVVGLLAVLAGIAWVVLTLAAPRVSVAGAETPGYFDPSRWDIFFEDPQLWTFIFVEGVWGTVRAALTATALAIPFGIVFSLLRSAQTRWIRIPTAVVLEFFRGMPVLLMMLFILLVFRVEPFWAVVIALVLYNGTLIGEALRAGLASLPRGQREAALSLGMRPLQSRMLVEFPQAFRQMLPVIVAQLVVLLKDTSLGFIVGYAELLRVTMNNLASFYGNRYLFSFFIVALVLYLAMNLTLSWVARWLSKRTASKTGRPGLDAGDPNQALLVAEATATARQSVDGGGLLGAGPYGLPGNDQR